MLYEKPPIKYTEMAMYIDSHIYSDDCDDEKIFIYLYHLSLMLAYRNKLFKRPEYYEDFALTFAEDMYLRLKNPKQEMLKEDGSPKMYKLTSILNYMKRTIYGRKVTFEQNYYSQSLSTITELEKELVSSDFDVLNQIYKYTKDYDEVEIIECLKNINIIIKDYIYKIPYLTDIRERENIYISCVITISYLFENAIRIKKPINNILYDVILYHLDDNMKNYIIVLCRYLLHEIADIFKMNLGPSFDEKEIINMMVLDAKDSEDIINTYE